MQFNARALRLICPHQARVPKVRTQTHPPSASYVMSQNSCNGRVQGACHPVLLWVDPRPLPRVDRLKTRLAALDCDLWCTPTQSLPLRALHPPQSAWARVFPLGLLAARAHRARGIIRAPSHSLKPTGSALKQSPNPSWAAPGPGQRS